MDSCNRLWISGRKLGIAVAVLSAGLLTAACGSTLRVGLSEQTASSANIEPIAGTALNRVKLTPKAAERIDVKTTLVSQSEVTHAGNKAVRKIVPYASVLYDGNSAAWVYTSPEPLVFIRHQIAIDYIEGDQAVLSDGPPPGTTVVSAGAAELFGTEFEKIQ
jgi:hypothetical protein